MFALYVRVYHYASKARRYRPRGAAVNDLHLARLQRFCARKVSRHG